MLKDSSQNTEVKMLRHVLVSVLIEPEFPIKKESKLDISLLRLLHQAVLRQQSGVTDALLFVVCCNSNEEEVTKSIKPYGFPDAQIKHIEVNDEDLSIHYDDLQNLINTILSSWLEKNHPAAITNLSIAAYENLDLWWSGIEATNTEMEWDFWEKYAATLPYAHRKKARTWLAILSEMLDIGEPCWLTENQFLLYAATLCEWLHGFKAASGDGYSDFDATEVYNALPLDDLYLGFLLGQSSPNEEFQAIMEDNELGDDSDIRGYIIKLATSNKRSELRDMLSSYFGSDAALFWALHHAIWPKYNEPTADLCNELVNTSSFEDVSEVADAWEFITAGWTDSADE